MDDDVCFFCGGGEELAAVVVAGEDLDGRVPSAEVCGCAAEEDGHGPVGISGCDGMQD